MKGQHLIGDIYTEISRELERALDGLTVDDLNQQPDSDCIGSRLVALMLREQSDTMKSNKLNSY